MHVIKNSTIVEAPCSHLSDEEQTPVSGLFSLSLKRFKQDSSHLDPKAGVRLLPNESPLELEGALAALPLVVLEMPAFTDGRSFSQARILRQEMGYDGEIRVIGDFLRDQMFFLSRLGVDTFEFPEGTNLQDRLTAFREFSVTYQAACDDPQPLYRRMKHA